MAQFVETTKERSTNKRNWIAWFETV